MTNIDSTGRLLAEVFPGARVAAPDYLAWVYEYSPFGSVIEANLDDEVGRSGHYALTPIALSANGIPLHGALSLNTAVHARIRGKGVFVQLAEEAYAEARKRGVKAVLGVANKNSTHGFLHRLGFELVAQLPATLLLPLPGPSHGFQSAWANEELLQSYSHDGLDALLVAPKQGIARVWTKDALLWRLSAPGSHYALHRSRDVLAVSCLDRRRGINVAVILKIFAVDNLPAAVIRALVRAVCRFHRAPIGLYVGVNNRVCFRGAPLPSRLREQPLNLIYRRLDDETQRPPLVDFEFLDFDAY